MMLAKKFIKAYFKVGIKRNTMTYILNFKQKEGEMMREWLDKLRQYIVRCPTKETRSEERLINCFLKGLGDRQLYKHLFTKDHYDFEECFFDAQRFEENCDL